MLSLWFKYSCINLFYSLHISNIYKKRISRNYRNMPIESVESVSWKICQLLMWGVMQRAHEQINWGRLGLTVSLTAVLWVWLLTPSVVAVRVFPLQGGIPCYDQCEEKKQLPHRQRWWSAWWVPFKACSCESFCRSVCESTKLNCSFFVRNSIVTLSK